MTTSDSIAALLAKRLGSDELVLLKSCSVPAAASPAALAEAGVVDAALPAASRGIGRVRVEQLP
jgi:5-(aminomethyl)-3-furanmethanol phosphate kinase